MECVLLLLHALDALRNALLLQSYARAQIIATYSTPYVLRCHKLRNARVLRTESRPNCCCRLCSGTILLSSTRSSELQRRRNLSHVAIRTKLRQSRQCERGRNKKDSLKPVGRRQAVWHFAYSSDGLQWTIHVFLRLEQTPNTRVATLGRLQYPHTQSATRPGVHLTSTSRDVCSQSDFSMFPSHA